VNRINLVPSFDGGDDFVRVLSPGERFVVGIDVVHVEKRPAVVALVKRLYRADPKPGERRSLREISADLVDAGYVNEYGKPYHPQYIQRMIDGDRPRDE
jgi:hypothetical protein